MRRRRLLALVATSPFLAGCNGLSPSEEPDESPRTSREPTELTTTTPSGESEPATTVSDAIFRERDPPSPDTLTTADRPSATEPPNATQDTVSPLSYPAEPASYTTETVADFVEAYESAYRRNSLLQEHQSTLIAQGAFVRSTGTLATAADAGIGRMQYVYSASYEDGEQVVVEDSAMHLVTYYVSESVVVRAGITDRAEQRGILRPDPWMTGVVLEPTE